MSKVRSVLITLSILSLFILGYVFLITFTEDTGNIKYDDSNKELIQYTLRHGQVSGVADSKNIEKTKWDLKKWREWEDEPTFIPSGWSGIPISIGNNLYKDLESIPQSKLLVMRLITTIKELTNEEKDDHELIRHIIEQYTNIIGFNGVMDAIQICRNMNVTLGFANIHHVGTFAAEWAERPRYAVEINSRMVMSLSPLHGAMWKVIELTNITDGNELYEFTQKELCFYKSEYETWNWLACVHGFGHGLAMIYGDDYDKGTDVCELSPDPHFQYYCAYGLFMTILQDRPNSYPIDSFSPCDVCRYPAACFQFKSQTARYLNFNNIIGPCNYLEPYYADGCAYGLSSMSPPVLGGPPNVARYCGRHYLNNEKRYNLCVDGFLFQNKILDLPNERKESICESLFYASAVELCKRKHLVDLGGMTPEQALNFSSFYPFESLEDQYNPHSIPHSFWNSSWPQIRH